MDVQRCWDLCFAAQKLHKGELYIKSYDANVQFGKATLSQALLQRTLILKLNGIVQQVYHARLRWWWKVMWQIFLLRTTLGSAFSKWRGVKTAWHDEYKIDEYQPLPGPSTEELSVDEYTSHSWNGWTSHSSIYYSSLIIVLIVIFAYVESKDFLFSSKKKKERSHCYHQNICFKSLMHLISL